MPFQFCVTCLSVCVCGPEQGNDWGLDEIFRQFPFLDADPSNWPVNTIPIETEISPVSSAPPDALPYSPPSITSRDVLRRDDNQSDESFAYSCFPHPHQDGLRAHLVNVLQQSWLFLNQPEPTGAFRFLLQDAEPGKQRCSICSKIYRRGGRALEHIRIHLGHKPFACFGGYIGCSQPSWCACLILTLPGY